MDGDTMQARSLREVFASMSHGPADPSAALADAGHGDLPPDLVSEAIVNYADAAPVEVAQHLSPFVVANSAVPASSGHPYPAADVHEGLTLLGSAPDPLHPDLGDHDPFDVDHHQTGYHTSLLDDGTHHAGPAVDPHHDGHLDNHLDPQHGSDPAGGHDTHADLWFGHGQAAALAPHLDAPVATQPDDTHHTHLDGGAQPDPWLDVHAVPEHATADAAPLWPEHAGSHEAAVHDLGHPGAALPVDDPGTHDLPADGAGHA